MIIQKLKSKIQNPKSKIVKTPTVLQMEAVECGAAALGMILGYYDRIVSLAELREECGVSRDGSKAANLVKAAQRYGMQAKGFKKGLEALAEVPVPYIVFWNFDHFLVVEGFKRDRVYLNDPASGRRRISRQEFSQAYTGIVLVMEPGPEFKKGGKKRNTLLALHSRLKNSYDIIFFSILAGLLLTLPRLAVPAFSQVFTDEILIQGRENWLRPLLLGMVITAVVQSLLARLRLIYLRRLTIKLSVVMTGQFIWHTLRLPVGFYANRFAGEIGNRTALNGKVVSVLNSISTTAIDTVMLVFYFLLMIMYDRVLTLMTVSFAAINLIALQALRRLRLDANLKISQESGKLSGAAIDSLQSLETVKASGLESDLFAKFAGYNTKAVNAQQELALQSQILTLLPTILTALATTALLIVGGFRVMEGNLTIGMLIAYQSLIGSFLGPVNNLVNFGSSLQMLEADLDRLDDILQNPVDPEIEREKVGEFRHQKSEFTSFKLQGYVELRNITFGYNPLEAPLIENFNLILKPGRRVALVGSSGSGKSTIAKLIAGLYAPWQGEILFDNVPRNQIPRLVLANSLAMVEQDIFLFKGTVRDNLTLWNSTVPTANLVQACQDAAIHDLIMSMPGGYDAEIAERGVNISGGQRQRLEIARALVMNPTVLILDEATSSLDAETEVIIDRNTRQRGCACIVVAHRLSTIRDCDEIIVLERGKIVQRGSHEELRQQGGIYSRLLMANG
ncbi:NHLP family bacteriocin export ABC transporter peptidase/permease/ATPase subunit [Argonema antarcticum]|uniref:NHLP family bacteriocin export ABC transporter peptidase/permease/ATPase subunit n=1 Tax=Argonema antarcticum TaxID=2942763 RepID=UPI0020111DD8|nr:NHLP family bacteriocin export ABC transporter peptidase/permease/ATPase subunit [Argonema antarcticum]MCL1471531.1 NHLP family bacteriocin export ABC transporter peptidase/permease/ATPase subunit [Argonema antarcticum A004/B2]